MAEETMTEFKRRMRKQVEEKRSRRRKILMERLKEKGKEKKQPPTPQTKPRPISHKPEGHWITTKTGEKVYRIGRGKRDIPEQEYKTIRIGMEQKTGRIINLKKHFGTQKAKMIQEYAQQTKGEVSIKKDNTTTQAIITPQATPEPQKSQKQPQKSQAMTTSFLEKKLPYLYYNPFLEPPRKQFDASKMLAPKTSQLYLKVSSTPPKWYKETLPDYVLNPSSLFIETVPTSSAVMQKGTPQIYTYTDLTPSNVQITKTTPLPKFSPEKQFIQKSQYSMWKKPQQPRLSIPDRIREGTQNIQSWHVSPLLTAPLVFGARGGASTVEMVTHPLETTKQTIISITHPRQTGRMLGEQLDTDLFGTLGEITVPAIITGKITKTVGKAYVKAKYVSKTIDFRRGLRGTGVAVGETETFPTGKSTIPVEYRGTLWGLTKNKKPITYEYLAEIRKSAKPSQKPNIFLAKAKGEINFWRERKGVARTKVDITEIGKATGKKRKGGISYSFYTTELAPTGSTKKIVVKGVMPTMTEPFLEVKIAKTRPVNVVKQVSIDYQLGKRKIPLWKDYKPTKSITEAKPKGVNAIVLKESFLKKTFLESGEPYSSSTVFVGRTKSGIGGKLVIGNIKKATKLFEKDIRHLEALERFRKLQKTKTYQLATMDKDYIAIIRRMTKKETASSLSKMRKNLPFTRGYFNPPSKTIRLLATKKGYVAEGVMEHELGHAVFSKVGLEKPEFVKIFMKESKYLKPERNSFSWKKKPRWVSLYEEEQILEELFVREFWQQYILNPKKAKIDYPKTYTKIVESIGHKKLKAYIIGSSKSKKYVKKLKIKPYSWMEIEKKIEESSTSEKASQKLIMPKQKKIPQTHEQLIKKQIKIIEKELKKELLTKQKRILKTLKKTPPALPLKTALATHPSTSPKLLSQPKLQTSQAKQKLKKTMFEITQKQKQEITQRQLNTQKVIIKQVTNPKQAQITKATTTQKTIQKTIQKKAQTTIPKTQTITKTTPKTPSIPTLKMPFPPTIPTSPLIKEPIKKKLKTKIFTKKTRIIRKGNIKVVSGYTFKIREAMIKGKLFEKVSEWKPTTRTYKKRKKYLKQAGFLANLPTPYLFPKIKQIWG